MSRQPIPNVPAENWENEGGSVTGETYAESLGVTRQLIPKYMVGGYSYSSSRTRSPKGAECRDRVGPCDPA